MERQTSKSTPARKAFTSRVSNSGSRSPTSTSSAFSEEQCCNDSWRIVDESSSRKVCKVFRTLCGSVAEPVAASRNRLKHNVRHLRGARSHHTMMPRGLSTRIISAHIARCTCWVNACMTQVNCRTMSNDASGNGSVTASATAKLIAG